MIRDLASYWIAGLALSGAAGGLYGGGVIGVPALYGLMTLAIVVSLVGYVRWDLRHYP